MPSAPDPSIPLRLALPRSLSNKLGPFLSRRIPGHRYTVNITTNERSGYRKLVASLHGAAFINGES